MLAAFNQPSPGLSRALYATGLGAVLVLAVLALWSAARLFWAVLPAEEATSVTPVIDPQTTLSERPAAGVDVAELHLFGQVGATLRPAMIEAPETQLNLTLLGTFTADQPDAGLAIVADESGDQNAYGAGDELPGGATLREVHLNRVVIEYQGRLESLSLERAGDAATGAAERTAQAPAIARSGPRQLADVDWQAARDQARIDPEKLAALSQQIRALPFSENGEPIGIRLMASRDAQVLTRLGLRSSDIILSVNGIPLTDPSRQFELMNLLNSQSRFQVRLRRNGREMTLNVDASQLQNP